MMTKLKRAAFLVAGAVTFLASCVGGYGPRTALPKLPGALGGSVSQQAAVIRIRGSQHDPLTGQESNYRAMVFPGSSSASNAASPIGRIFVLKSKVTEKSVAPPPGSQGVNLGYANIVVQPGDQCGAAAPVSSNYCISFVYPVALDPSCVSLAWYVNPATSPGDLPATIAMPFTQYSSLTGSTYVSVTSQSTNNEINIGKFYFYVTAACTGPSPKGVLPGGAYFWLANVNVTINDQTGTGKLVTLHDQVGAQQSLFAQTDPAGAESYMANPTTWTIPSDPSVSIPQVANYIQSNTAASYTLPVNATTNPLSYYPTAAYHGGDNLTFEASTVSAGTAYHAEVPYIIDAPTLASVSAPTGEIYVDTSGKCSGPTYCGLLGTSGNGYDAHGIQWTASWTSPNINVHGLVGMTQLADITIYNTFPQPGPTPNEYNDWYPAVDFAPQFGQATGAPQATLAESSMATYYAVDDTRVPLYSCQALVWPYEGFTDYFTFTPDPKGNFNGIPVTLGTMTWDWEAVTAQSGGAWLAPVIWAPLSASDETPSTTLPTWIHNAQQELNYYPHC